MTRRPTTSRSRTLWRLAALVFGLVVVVAVGRTLLDQDWSVLTEVLRRRDPEETVALMTVAVLTAMAGPLLGMFSWRGILAELGPPVPLVGIVRIYYVGFLAKYVPGKVPGLIATVKVASANDVPMPRMLVSGTLHMVVIHLTGLTIGLLTGVRILGGQALWLVPPALLVAAVLIWPSLLDRAATLALRVLRRPQQIRSLSRRAVRVAVLWQISSWLVGALHVWLLAVLMGADAAAALPLCLGAFTLASVIGVLTVVTPDGLGVREVALTGALALVLPVPSAVAVAVASRLVVTFADAVFGVVALGTAEFLHRRRSGRDVTPVEPGVDPADHLARS
ncbi:lysylphosphatidylglycerol synthase domain-containing protein [Micromonospora sp. SH-82]|uniref:lysylphosphatidylglycerol synthase domain-containing protein n=1 Tax=Micromonospora sp. SH-82 TaxID=3132938 RepID=UPI003EBD3D8C